VSRPFHSTPVVPIRTPALDCFRDVFGCNRRRLVQIGNSARDLQHPVVRARRKAHALHRHFESALFGFIERALLADRPRRQSRIRAATGLLHLNPDIDPVDPRAADLTRIALDDGWRAAAFAGRRRRSRTGKRPANGWADRLVQCRTVPGLSQRESAARIGVAPCTLARWERGEQEPAGRFATRALRVVAGIETAWWPLATQRPDKQYSACSALRRVVKTTEAASCQSDREPVERVPDTLRFTCSVQES
jgi:transcriptional regulator with XRE-family HTH domain